MRIGMILDKSFPPDPRVENEALALIKAGHEVFLFCLTYSAELKDVVYKGIQVNRYSSNRITYKLSALAYELPLYSFILKPKIKNYIRKNKIDVLHVHDMRIAGTVFSLNKKNQLPIVLDLHDNFPEVMKEYPHLKKFPGKYIIKPQKWVKKEQEFIEKATKIISVSQEFVDSIKNRLTNNHKKVVLVPNTVRKSFYSKALFDKDIIKKFENDFVLLYVGDTGLRRGLQTAIEAIPILKKKIPNIRLVIVGTSTEDIILQKLAKDLGIENTVSFEAWQDEKLFPSYIKSAAIGISPLFRNKQHDVAYANKLFQYMSFGLPVLVSNATAQENFVNNTKTGLVHLEKDVIDFSEKVLLLYNDKDLYSTFGKNAKSYIENEFNWEITAKELANMYKELQMTNS